MHLIVRTYHDGHADIKKDVSACGIFENTSEHFPRVQESVRFARWYPQSVMFDQETMWLQSQICEVWGISCSWDTVQREKYISQLANSCRIGYQCFENIHTGNDRSSRILWSRARVPLEEWLYTSQLRVLYPDNRHVYVTSFGFCDFDRWDDTLDISLPIKSPLIEVARRKGHVVRHRGLCWEIDPEIMLYWNTTRVRLRGWRGTENSRSWMREVNGETVKIIYLPLLVYDLFRILEKNSNADWWL
jgi:hypothetical protein